MVGILLPPSVPGALVNFAAMLMGKVPVNLNYTVSEETLTSCIRQCGIRTVITSKAFLEKVKLRVGAETEFLEDVASHPNSIEKVIAFLTAWLLPAGLLERFLGRKKKIELDDLAKTRGAEIARVDRDHRPTFGAAVAFERADAEVLLESRG